MQPLYILRQLALSPISWGDLKFLYFPSELNIYNLNCPTSTLVVFLT